LANGIWTPYGGRDDLPKTGILTSEFTDSLGRVWFGYTKSQLAVLDGDRVRVFGPSDGLQVGTILAIHGRGPEIWIGGEFGLEQFDQGRFHKIAAMDVDFDSLELRVIRSIWHQKIGDCKTEASAKPVPLDGYMAEDLLQWRKKSPYPMQEDWVFASPTMKGERPYWPVNLMKRYIKPVARANGIYKNIGWHTFGLLLKANGEDVKTVQELLRHANSRITLDVYTQAVGSNKRAAQSKVVRMMIPGMGQNAGEMDPQKAQVGA
jgi:hypothetical protein